MSVGTTGLILLAAVIVAGGVVAVSAGGARSAILGLAAALAASAFMADPLPDLRAIGVRVVGAALAAYPLLAVVRTGNGRTTGSRLGWPAEALLAAAVGVAGYAVGSAIAAGSVGPATDETGAPVPVPLALAAGLALLAITAGPIALSNDATRLGIGLVLATDAAILVLVGLLGTPDALASIAAVALIAAVAGASALLVRGARSSATAGGPGAAPAGRPPAPVARR